MHKQTKSPFIANNLYSQRVNSRQAGCVPLYELIILTGKVVNVPIPLIHKLPKPTKNLIKSRIFKRTSMYTCNKHEGYGISAVIYKKNE